VKLKYRNSILFERVPEVFSKLFGSKKVPHNSGKKLKLSQGTNLKTLKVFELELSNMEGLPHYILTHQLSIGSEIGNIVISDPSISPRHCTFQLQDGVVSILDHASLGGTFVNGKPISSGQHVILEESDVIGVGDLEVRIRTKLENVQEASEKESAPAQEFVEKKPELKLITSTSKVKVSKQEESLNSANSLIRVMAVCSDVLLAYSVLTIFHPFDEFRYFLEFIPQEFARLLDIEWSSLWEAVTADHEQLRQAVSELYAFIIGPFPLVGLYLVFILMRKVGTLLLGVSISEFILGMRASGNGVWARVGGLFRVIIGALTGPLLIFDLPSIISKRTLKEFFSFTNVYLKSTFNGILGTILLLPTLLAVALVSPLFQGLEPQESISVNDRLDQRLKAQATTTSETEVTKSMMSEFFGVNLTYDSAQVSVMPTFKFQGTKKGLALLSEVTFYYRELQRPVVIELQKRFDFKQLLGIGFKGNFFLFEKFPEIYSYVYEASGTPGFKTNDRDAKIQSRFSNELMIFNKMALELNSQNAFEIMQTETLLLKGLIDYKNSLMALLGSTQFSSIGFIKLGNVIFMKVSYLKKKPYDLLIPMLRGEGRVFKVTFDKNDHLTNLSTQFYKYTFDNSEWLNPTPNAAYETLNAFQVLDLLAVPGALQQLTPEKAQALYGFYFEASSEILKRNDEAEWLVWKKAVGSLLKVFEGYATGISNEEAPEKKLFYNFRDLSDAVENKNFDYFGASATTTI